jgi:uncharacterized protein (TIGR03067 family)
MAVSTNFKQQCPSCEAMISIKESMIGKKVECTKCKDKFIAERPDDDEPEEKSPSKKDTRLAKKNTSLPKNGATGITGKTPLAAAKRPKLEVEDDETNGKAGKNKAETNGKSAQKSRQDDDEDEDEVDGETKKKKVKAGAGGSNKLVIGLGLAVVGVVILSVAAFFVMNSGNKNSAGIRGGGNLGGNPDQNEDAGQKKDTKKPEDIKLPDPVAALTDAELARLSNLLPADSEHVFHVFAKDLFHANSPLREAAFATPGTLDDADLKKKLGFSILAIDDILVAEKYTMPGWKYTVLHFMEIIKKDELKAALELEPVTIDGQKCFKTVKAHPCFDHLARFSFGIPNQLRYVDARPREKPSLIHIYNAQTLVIGDEAAVKAMLAAKGQFAQPSNSKTPVNPNPGGGGEPKPGGIKERNPMPGGSQEGKALPAIEDRTPMPGDSQERKPKPGDIPEVNPNPNPAPQHDAMYMTIKPSLKAILDRMELRSTDSKVLFSSATDMDANRVESKNGKDTVSRRPRQFWDVTILLNEKKPRIRNLGTALIQKDMLNYQLRNELTCAQQQDAKGFQDEMIEHTSYQVKNFIQNLTKHEVRLPTVEKKEPPPPPNPNPPPGPMQPPFGRPQPPEQKPEEKKPQDASSSQITVNHQPGTSTVEFVLDLVLDNLALTQIQGITTLTASVIRVEMEAAAHASLRHLLGGAGKLLGEKGLTEGGVAPGRFPPGAFQRDRTALITDREPRNRISWMAGLLPYMGHQNLFQRIQFNQSWRDPSNWMAGNTIVPQFLDPTYPDNTRQLAVGDLTLDFAATHFVGNAGVGLDAASYKRGDPATAHKRGPLSYDDSASLDEIHAGRGVSNTILMIQVPHDGVTGVSPWIAGGGATLRGVPETNSIAPFVLSTDRNRNTIVYSKDGGKTKQRGTFVLMTDGSVRFIDQNIKEEVFKAMCTVGGPALQKAELDKDPLTPLVRPPEGKEMPKPAVEKQPPVENKPTAGKTIDEVTAALQGTWVATSFQAFGKDAPPEVLKGFSMTFKGAKILATGNNKNEELSYTIDVTKSPYQMDTTGPRDKTPDLGIFELKNGELRLCIRPSERSTLGRPTNLTSADALLMVFRKQGP